jgi:23S rRNA (uridine2552-2'-O)-methyltransferase
MAVVDLGCAPGGWMQVASIRTKLGRGPARLVGIDLLETENIVDADIFVGDMMDDVMLAKVRDAVDGAADGVLSDMAASTTGHRSTDHLRTTALLEAALDFAVEILNKDGFFLAKCFRGGTERSVLDLMQRNFTTVRHVKPAASRQESVESYVLATGFHGAQMATADKSDQDAGKDPGQTG